MTHASRIFPRPSLFLGNYFSTIASFNDTFSLRIMNTQHRAQGWTNITVDAGFRINHKPAEEVIFKTMDGIYITRAGMFTSTATDTGFIDIEIAFNHFRHAGIIYEGTDPFDV